jgi:hypothetical protein
MEEINQDYVGDDNVSKLSGNNKITPIIGRIFI